MDSTRKVEGFILIFLGLTLYFKMRYHWKYYLIANGLDEGKKIDEYFQKTTKASSFIEGLIDLLRFPGPFFNEVVLYDEQANLLKKLRLKIYLLLFIWWSLLIFMLTRVLINLEL